jgi:hypothetical protein
MLTIGGSRADKIVRVRRRSDLQTPNGNKATVGIRVVVSWSSVTSNCDHNKKKKIKDCEPWGVSKTVQVTGVAVKEKNVLVGGQFLT